MTIDTGGAYVFRHEPSDDPARMQMFHMREFVRIGEPETSPPGATSGCDAGLDLLRRLGLDAGSEVASDPFFGRERPDARREPARAGAQVRVLVQIGGPEPTAIASFNYHQDHFTPIYDIDLRDGGVAHTGCLAFGIERIIAGPVPGPRPRPVGRGRPRSARSSGR